MTPRIITGAAILIVTALIIFNFGDNFKNIFFRDKNEVTQKSSQSIPQENKIQEKTTDVVLDTKSNLQEQVQGVADTVNQFLDQTTNTLLGKKPQSQAPATVVVLEKAPQNSNAPITQIDFLKDRQLKLVIPKNTPYYFEFQNVPADFCLYLNQNKYKIEGLKIVAVTFAESGTYTLAADFCEPGAKDIGRLIVE